MARYKHIDTSPRLLPVDLHKQLFPRRATGNELHAARNDLFAGVLRQQMYMVGRHHVVQHAQPEALACFEQPVQV